ncbi:MAG: sugar ABC transporter substrate-binding protein, partial [Lachnospiraceae bacterium]|nr:sugar ABC transporter substrate-binding protein [Lachnospiraceae bacterium]
MKKRMRWIAVVLSVVCVIETMGCGTTPKENNTTQETINTTEGEVSEGAKRFEGTTIYMIAEQQTPTEALKKQLDLFTEETGIVV